MSSADLLNSRARHGCLDALGLSFKLNLKKINTNITVTIIEFMLFDI